MMRLVSLVLGLVLTVGCGPGQLFEDVAVDVDGDGFVPEDGDCDDREPAAHPAHPEICDGIDNDCDEAIDGDDADVGDADGDGSDACSDCDDAEPLASPDFTEACDGLDTD